MEKINVYIDGPNLVGAASQTLKKRVWLDPFGLANCLIDSHAQALNKVYYFETPYPGGSFTNELFKKQQKFFGAIFEQINTKRVIHIEGSYRIDFEKVPEFLLRGLRPDLRQIIESLRWRRPREKGGDVGLAVRLVRDAFQNGYDHAFIVSEDVDFASAINIALESKKISICYTNNESRNAKALRNKCPQAGFVQITRKEIERLVINTD